MGHHTLDLLPYVENIGSVFAAVLIESILYGAHLILFSICAFILIKRKNPAQILILLSTCIMFTLATADIAMSFQLLTYDVPSFFRFGSESDLLQHIYFKSSFYVTNNLLADGLLLHRFYVVWGERKWTVIVPALLLVADSVWGYVTSKPTTTPFILHQVLMPLFFWSVLGFNVIMCATTAGRVWWISRGALPILGKQQIQRYYTAIVILIESGVIYSLSLILLMATPPSEPYRLIFFVIVMRVVGIMPTLIVVQVELSRNIPRPTASQMLEPKVMSLQDNHPDGQGLPM